MLYFRIVVAVMGLFATFNVYVSRMNLTITIVKMVNPHQSHSTTSECTNSISNLTVSVVQTKNESEENHFDWTHKQQGLMLGAYFYGYTFMMPFTGHLSYIFGARKLLSASMLFSSMLTITYPYVINLPSNGFVYGLASRILLGIGHAPFFPTLVGFWASWGPKNEISRLVCSAFIGAPIGTICVTLFGGQIMKTIAWPNVFYICGFMNIVFVVLWFLLVRDKPDDHPYVSAEEKIYIINNRVFKSKPKSLSYSSLFTSLPFWAIIVSSIGHLYTTYTYLLLFPKYLNDIQGLDIKQVGVGAALPIFVSTTIMVLSSYLADYLCRKGYRRTTVRRVCNFGGSVIPGLFCFLFYFAGCHIARVVTICILLQTLALQQSGSKTNLNDMCPAYAAIGMAFVNCLGNATGFIAPSVAGALLDTYGDSSSTWSIIFGICGGVTITTGLFYQKFSDASLQKWATGDDEFKENENLELCKE